MLELDDPLFIKLRDLVYELSGMYFSDKRKYFFTRRVEHRIEAAGASDATDYYQMLRFGRSSAELHALTEMLTTNETYFFREYPQLQAFANAVLPEVLEEKRKRNVRYLRVWSAGCSTGDEPYTLAIILKEMIEDFGRWEITITATDISPQVLAIARRAVYDERAIKDVPHEYRERHFTSTPDGYSVMPAIRKMVRFRQANLLDESVGREMDGQDFVFCRNVLIYFDDASRRRVVDMFYDALCPGGYIFLGHSESVGRITSAFRVVRRDGALVYTK
jgi:chemotaxis protein methyltransferase CheR